MKRYCTDRTVFPSFSDSGYDENYITNIKDNKDGTTEVAIRNFALGTDYIYISKPIGEVEKEIRE